MQGTDITLKILRRRAQQPSMGEHEGMSTFQWRVRRRVEEREERESSADLIDARVQLPIVLPVGLHLSRVLVALRGRLVEAFVDERLVAQTLALHLRVYSYM